MGIFSFLLNRFTELQFSCKAFGIIDALQHAAGQCLQA
jgi:hypothetical protein